MAARWQYLVQESFIGLRRNLLMTVAVVLSVAVSLVLLGSSLLVQKQVGLTAGDWVGKIEVSIFLCDEETCETGAISPDQQEGLRQALEDDPLVERVYYESKQEAYESFLELYRDHPELTEAVTADALPASFRVKLFDPAQYSAIRDKFIAYPGVEEIIDQSEAVGTLLSLTDALTVGAIVLAVALLLIACVLIVNTIRVAAFARREQTSIMRLVGASNWYIRMPFILEGVFAGIIGSVVAWLLLFVLVWKGTDFLQPKIRFINAWIGVPEMIAIAPLLVLVGVLIAAVSSFVALHRFLDV